MEMNGYFSSYRAVSKFNKRKWEEGGGCFRNNSCRSMNCVDVLSVKLILYQNSSNQSPDKAKWGEKLNLIGSRFYIQARDQEQ